MLTIKQLETEWEIAKMEVRQLSDERLRNGFEDYTSPGFVSIALERSRPHFGEMSTYLVAINYFALKREMIRRASKNYDKKRYIG